MKTQRYSRWVLFFGGVILLTSFFFRFYHPQADLPIQLSWSNAATQDASWYTSAAAHKALGLPNYHHGREKHLNKMLFTGYCFVMYKIFGVTYTTNTLLSALIGMASIVFLFLLLMKMPSPHRLKIAFAVSCLLGYNYVAIAFSRVPLLYTPINFFILLILLVWMAGRKRPWLILVAWGLTGLGFYGIKVLVPLIIAPALLVGHLFLLSEHKNHKKTLGLILLTLVGAFLYLSWSGKLLFVLAKYSAKLSSKPLSPSEWLEHILAVGSTSRFFLRNPFLSLGAFAFPVFFFLDRRKFANRLLEVVFLVWFLTIFFFSLPLNRVPLRFLSLMIIPMVGCWAFLLEKFFYWKDFSPSEKRPLRVHRWRYRRSHRFGRARDWGILVQNLNWRTGLAFLWLTFSGIFLGYQAILEGHFGWQRGFVKIFAPMDLSIRHQYFSSHFSITMGLVLISLSGLVLVTRQVFLWVLRWGRPCLALAILASLLLNLANSFAFLRQPTYTQYNFARETASVLGKNSHLAGAYAHALTLGTSLKRSAIFSLTVAWADTKSSSKYLKSSLFLAKKNPLAFLRKVAYPDLFRFHGTFTKKIKRRGITHLALPRFQPDAKKVANFFARADTPLYLVRVMYLRGWRVQIYRICWEKDDPFRAYLLGEKYFQRIKKRSRAYWKKFRVYPYMFQPIRLLPIYHFQFSLNRWRFLQKTEVDRQKVLESFSLILKNLGSAKASLFEQAYLLLQTSEKFKELHQELIQNRLKSSFSPKTYRALVQKALSTFQTVSAKYSYAPLAIAYQGRCTMRLGHWKEAEKLFKEALKMNPYDAEIWEMLATYYELKSRGQKRPGRIENLTRALNCLDKMTRLYPSSFTFKRRLQGLYLEIQRLKK